MRSTSLEKAPSTETVAGFLAGGGEMGAMMRAKNWAFTPLGDPENWPQSLKIAIRIMLTSRYAMWMAWGPDLTFFCNDAYKPTLGIKGDWVLGAPSNKVWEEIWPDIGPRIQTVFETGIATWDEALLLFLERSGYPEETYHTFSYSPLPGEDGDVAGMLCVVTEETVRVISERRLVSLNGISTALSSVQKQSDVFNSVERQLNANQKDFPFALIYLVEDDGRVLQLAAASGMSGRHAIGSATIENGDALHPVTRLLTQSDPITIDLAQHAPLLPSGEWNRPPRAAVAVRIAGQTSERPAGVLVIGLNPYRPFDDAYAGFIDLVAGQIAASLTSVRGLEQERKRAEALAEIDRAKTTFFSNVSHEFRTPLTLLMSPLEELLSKPATQSMEENRALVDVAHRNSLRLLKLVNTLLDFSRIEAGRVQARYEPHDLAEWTTELASNFRSATDRAGLKLTIDCAALSEPIYIDRDMWEKIVLNLISNAFKFTFDGGIEVSQKLSSDGKNVELAVRDTGTGIAAEEMPRLFERFHRVEGAVGRSFEGSGIGLALVQELVKLHGGSIRVSSELNRGSTFTVSIPRGSAHLPQDRLGAGTTVASTALRPAAFVQEALRWLGTDNAGKQQSINDDAAGRGVADLVSSRDRPRILVADDNADMRDYINRLLDPFFDVAVVADGEAALASARSRLPALVLSDVMMPRLDGFGLIKALRADARLREMPVILLSARAGDEAKIEGFEAGADDYLVKPFSARELVARVQANLEAARIRKEAEETLRKRTIELETVLETVPTAVWFTNDSDARRVAGNKHAADMMRVSPTGNFSLSAPEAERPDYRVFRNNIELPVEALPIQRAARGEDVPDEELEVRFADGTAICILTRARPIRDLDGALQGAVCAAVDITERVKADKQRQLLVNELNHRVKNTLATVQSLAMQTMRGITATDARRSFDARLASLSRAHDLLTSESWEGADLGDVVRRALEPFRTEERFLIKGPRARLVPKQALAFSMALYELATNAVKYGALSIRDGSIEISWQLAPRNGTEEVMLTWAEKGGPVVSQPSRKGFGSRLIERSLALDLGGDCSIEYRPEGVVSVIRTSIGLEAGQAAPSFEGVAR